MSRFRVLVCHQGAFVRPFERKNVLRMIIRRLRRTFLRVSPIYRTRQPIQFTNVIRRPREFLRTFGNGRMFSSLVPKCVPIYVIIRSRSQDNRLVRVRRKEIFGMLRQRFPSVTPCTALPIFVLRKAIWTKTPASSTVHARRVGGQDAQFSYNGRPNTNDWMNGLVTSPTVSLYASHLFVCVTFNSR